MIQRYIKGIRYGMQVDPYDESLGVVELKVGKVRINFIQNY